MSRLRFVKMHGLGNDYIYVDCFAQTLPLPPPQLSRLLSDRRFGIGGDGLILIFPSSIADCRMEVYNADGSRAEMCGNGIRCVGKHLFDTHVARKSVLSIETDAGLKELELTVTDGLVTQVRVDMGEPGLSPESLPVELPGPHVISFPLSVGETTQRITCVSMGNPHCVVFVEDVGRSPVETLGPLLETHAVFPRRTNVEFVQVIGPNHLRVRVWERGSGETLACGTGACAAVVAGVLTGHSDRAAIAELPGGQLAIHWSADTGRVYMTGPAVRVYEGEIDLEEFLSSGPRQEDR